MEEAGYSARVVVSVVAAVSVLTSVVTTVSVVMTVRMVVVVVASPAGSVGGVVVELRHLLSSIRSTVAPDVAEWWWRGLLVSACSAWKIASATSCFACSLASL